MLMAIINLIPDNLRRTMSEEASILGLRPSDLGQSDLQGPDQIRRVLGGLGSSTLNPKPEALNPKPQTLSPKLNPKA